MYALAVSCLIAALMYLLYFVWCQLALIYREVLVLLLSLSLLA